MTFSIPENAHVHYKHIAGKPFLAFITESSSKRPQAPTLHAIFTDFSLDVALSISASQVQGCFFGRMGPAKLCPSEARKHSFLATFLAAEQLVAELEPSTGTTCRKNTWTQSQRTLLTVSFIFYSPPRDPCLQTAVSGLSLRLPGTISCLSWIFVAGSWSYEDISVEPRCSVQLI